ncbi:hypothetical protein RJ639_006302 [Escallonia herrerae]|uniref:DUF538 domain-containing protein n=1 Tax=Escallonia herrerae TaxID=1293975 RepID=A0AA88VXN0_9ASTE|nr:hypothetical protein RJ639_006302 [Escallonia herrerae]
MTSQRITDHRQNADVFTGEVCKQKSKELLASISLPRGLLPLDDIVEVGHNKSTGFVWLKQMRRKDHKFRKIGKTVSYDTEVTAFVEERRMRRLTGVKSKELLIWITVTDIYIVDVSSGKITFGTASGISRSYPVSAFEADDDEN